MTQAAPALILQVLLILFVGAFIFLPLFRLRGQRLAREGDIANRRRSIAERKTRLYQQVMELDFDRDSGKISPEDHARMREETMTEVLQVLAEEERLDGPGGKRAGAARGAGGPGAGAGGGALSDDVERLIEEMKKRHTALLLALAVALLGATFGGPREAHAFSIQGRVLKGSERAPVSGQTLSLHVVRGNEEIPGATRATGSDGSALFTSVPEGNGLEYYLSTEYKGAVYTEGPLQAGPDGSWRQDLVVYDVGKEIDKVSVANHHIIIENQKDGLHINEIIIIENTASTAYLGIGPNHAENAGMRLGLPASVKEFHAGMGADDGSLVTQGREMMSLRPIPPGRQPLSFAYHVPLSGRMDLSHRFYFPTHSFVVMLDDPRLKLESKILTYSGSREQGGKKYEVYTGADLEIGSEVEIRVLGASFWSNPAVYPWLAIPFVVAGVLVFARRMAPRAGRSADSTSARPSAPPNGASAADDLASTYAFLIATLDRGRERGDVSEESHALVRGNLKRRLELILSDRPAGRGSRHGT